MNSNNNDTKQMRYEDLDDHEKQQLRSFVDSSHNRFLSYRSNKENMAWGGIGVFLAASGSLLFSPSYIKELDHKYDLILILAFTILLIIVQIYLRFQLKARRWAAFRVAGCDWLMAEWLPGSPKAMKKEKFLDNKKPNFWINYIDMIIPLKNSVNAVTPDLHVYPLEIEQAWKRAEKRNTKAYILEWIMQIMLWISYLMVIIFIFKIR